MFQCMCNTLKSMCDRFKVALYATHAFNNAFAQEYRTIRAVTIHHAHESLVRADSALGGAMQDLAALRLSSKVALVRDTSAAAPRMLRGQGPRIALRLHNRANPASRAREVTLYSPYWLVNKADQTLRTRDAGLAASLPTYAPAPASGASAQPVLLSAPRGIMRLAVHPGFWSRSVHLDALGLHSSVHVLGPAHPTGPGAVRANAAAFAAAAASSQHVCWLEAAQPIASRGAPARRRKQGNRAVRPASALPAGGPMARVEAKSRAEGPVPRKPEAIPGTAEHGDRGYVAWRKSSLTSASAPMSASDSAKAARERQRLRRYDFAMEAVLGPSAFHRTKARHSSARTCQRYVTNAMPMNIAS